MNLHFRLVAPFALVLAWAAVAEAGQETANAVTPVVGLGFMGWVLVSALLSINHPSISTRSLVLWFLLFFPVSLIFFNGNVEAYLFIWYAYVAMSFLAVFLMKNRLDPNTRRFLLEWKGVTLLAIMLLAVLVRMDLLACVSEFHERLVPFATPEFVYVFGMVSWAVFSFTFIAYYLASRHS